MAFELWSDPAVSPPTMPRKPHPAATAAAVPASAWTVMLAGAPGSLHAEPPLMDSGDPAAIAARSRSAPDAALKTAQAEGGPARAIPVCQQQAPRMAAALSAQSGWQVRRIGVRVREPSAGTPDAWERRQLDDLAARRAAGEPAGQLRLRVLTGEGGAIHERYLQAIVTAPMCLSCHGAAEQLAPAVRAALAARYPDDRATGFKAGGLRAALSLTRTPIADSKRSN
ncbi:MAG: hypothetical protein C0434_10445 [Xanthomonadaceae bacterium]|nr:hypothetical protein [Xanthomonadaceae bacterium]